MLGRAQTEKEKTGHAATRTDGWGTWVYCKNCNNSKTHFCYP